MADASVPPVSKEKGVSKKKGLIVRLTVAPTVLALVLALLAWHARTGVAYGTDAVLALMAAGAAFEVVTMLEKAGRPGHRTLALAFSGALAGLGFLAPASAVVRGELRSLILVLAVIDVFVRHLRAPRPGDLDRIVTTLFPIVFVGYLFGLLRELGDGADGARRVIFVVVASKASDIGGWLVGKSIGRHKMIPSVSPGKTWEGTAGGLAFSVGAALLVRALAGDPHRLADGAVETAVVGFALGVASIVAGLAHSALKRRCGAKDSSSLLPEMGGVLDMIDSLLLAAPLAWFIMQTRGA